MAITEVTPVLGFSGTVSVNSATPRVSNLRFSTTYSEIDATTNADGGKRVYIKGLQDVSISFDMQVDSTTGCSTVMSAAAARTAVPVSVSCTGSSLTVSSSLMHVFLGEASMSPDGIVTIPVTCRPAPTEGSASST